MIQWFDALIIAVSATIIIITISYLLIRCRNKKVGVTQQLESTTTEPQTSSFRPEIETKRRQSYQLFHLGSSTGTFFNWADHPALSTDAVENGWSGFAFTNYTPSRSSVRSSLFNSLRVTAGDHNTSTHNHVEESWEVGVGSAELMQKIHFTIDDSNSNSFSTVRMALPLPGPPVANSFPQEAYFEITVLSSSESNGTSVKGGDRGEKAKLLMQQSDSSAIKKSVGRAPFLEELKNGGGRKGGQVREGPGMTLGLTVGGLMTNKVPGSYPGSIGFNSNRSVYLAGIKLVPESEKDDCVQMGKIIGCGFNPKLKRVFLTIDSELIHVIHCKSEDFGMPLYPIFAVNLDITISVNLGQSNFSYAPANAYRTPNPCFIGPLVKSPEITLGYDDSQELFSMGRIDSKWLSYNATVRSTSGNNSNFNNYYNNNNRTIEYDEESEAELFEIALDWTTRSPNIV